MPAFAVVFHSSVLRDPGISEAGGALPSVAGAPTAAPAAGSPAPAGPPAAHTVLNGTKTEAETKLEADLQSARDRETQLLTDLEKERAEKKEREIKIAELEDSLTATRWRPFKL